MESSTTDNVKPSDLRERILTAARDNFYAKGFYATNMRVVASSAGTSESGIYRHFPGAGGKFALLMAVYDRCWGEINESIKKEILSKEFPPDEMVVQLVNHVLSLYDTNPLLMSFIIINTGNTDTLLVDRQDCAIITAENLKYIETLGEICNQGQKLGKIDDSISNNAIVEGILGLTEGVLIGWYLADKTKNGQWRYPDKISVNDALVLVEKIIRPNVRDEKG